MVSVSKRVCWFVWRVGLDGCINSNQFCSNDSAVDGIMPILACLAMTVTEFSNMRGAISGFPYAWTRGDSNLVATAYFEGVSSNRPLMATVLFAVWTLFSKVQTRANTGDKGRAKGDRGQAHKHNKKRTDQIRLV